MISHSPQGKDLYLNQTQIREINDGEMFGGAHMNMMLPMMGPMMNAVIGGGCSSCEMKHRMELLEASGLFRDFGSMIKKSLEKFKKGSRKALKNTGEKVVSALAEKARELTPKAIKFLKDEAQSLADMAIEAANKEATDFSTQTIDAVEKKARKLLEKLGSGVSLDIKDKIVMDLKKEGITKTSKITAAKLKKMLEILKDVVEEPVKCKKAVKSTDKRKTRGLLIKKLMKENPEMTLPEASAFIKDNDLKY